MDSLLKRAIVTAMVLSSLPVHHLNDDNIISMQIGIGYKEFVDCSFVPYGSSIGLVTMSCSASHTLLLHANCHAVIKGGIGSSRQQNDHDYTNNPINQRIPNLCTIISYP